MGILCPDAIPSFLNIFDLSIAPKILFYTYGPVVAVSIFIGVYVLVKDHFSLASKLLFAVSFSFTLWVANIFFAWLAAYAGHVMLSWMFTPIFESLIFISSIYFTHVFIDEKRRDISFRLKSILLIVCLPLLIILPSKLSIQYFDLSICEGVPAFTWYYYMYALEIVAIFWVIFICVKKYISLSKANLERKKIIYFMIGMSGFLGLFVGSNLVGQITLIQEISFVGSLGMAIFIGFLAYLIVKYKAFNIKLIATQALVTALVILIASELFFAESATNQILILSTLAISLGFGYMLIKSVKSEVERKEQLQMMSDKLAVANDQLRKLDNAKTEFISIASHQLRTPLTAIKGFISLLLEGSYGKLNSKHQDVLNKVYTSNERLITLVEDLLNISRIESGRMEYKFERWDVAKMCSELNDSFVFKAKDRNLYLDYKKPEHPLPKIMTDGGKLREVISNLIDNALKYTPRGGVSIRLSKVGESIQVAVTDTGIGVPKEEIPYLFAKFSRGKDTSRLNTGGIGLGLYVGRSMMEALGGKIWAESEGEGKGSKFIIEVPIDRPEE